MKRVLKKYFVPHEENDHKPHFLRPKTLGVIVMFVLLLEGLFFLRETGTLPGMRFLASVVPTVLVSQTNDQRVDNQVGVLHTSPVLEAAAQAKANDMAAKGYFAHKTPDGKDPWYWFAQAGYAFTYAGENLAVNFTESHDVTTAWMNSPEHRANIVNGHFTEIGIATAQGMYKGQQATFVVELFGTPAAKQAPLALTPEPPATTTTTSTSAVTTSSQVAGAAASSNPKSPVAIAPATKQPVQTPPKNSETFVSVKGANLSSTAATTPVASQNLETVAPEQHVSPIAEVAASPKSSVRYIFLFFISLILVALMLKLIVSAAQHPRQYAHGMAVILLIGCALALNRYVSLKNTAVLAAHTQAALVQVLRD